MPPKSSSVPVVRLKKPLERSLRAGHPWVYRDALAPFELAAGDEVRVVDKQGAFIARGLVDEGPIGVRVWSTEDEPLSDALLSRRIALALSHRERILPPETDAYRLLHGEGDRVPGFVCDRYGSFAVLRLDGAAALAHRPRFERALREPLGRLGVASLLVRAGRKDDARVSLAWGKLPEPELYVREHGMFLCANLLEGQKTGLFLDHRESRARVRELVRGARVLNLYGYTGGFSVAAGLGSASEVTTVDIAAPALAYAEKSWAANALEEDAHRTHAQDALEFLRQAGEKKARYDFIVADPPNFAPRQSASDAALRAYQALHASVQRVLEPGGYYLAASCSSHVSQTDFDDTLRQAASRVRRSLQVLERTGAPADHPRLLAFPEGDYLKVSLLRA